MLKFLGKGSAFNTEVGNTSAYIKKGKSMILIDCGGTIFSELKRRNLLDFESLYIIITHTHPDHVGSLGDLIFYSHYIKGIKPNIYFPHKKTIEDMLTYVGVSKEFFSIESRYVNWIKDENFGNVDVEFYNTKHVVEIPAYGFILKIDGNKYYYSGDTSEVNKEATELLEKYDNAIVYHEASSLNVPKNPHTNIEKIKEAFKKEVRNRVFLMHLDSNLKEEELKQEGFKIAEIDE
ncbi:MBL fold metallo-hydrolase [uncultured Clostridium sp.]|uniref:MBL fold metallo-hydrolase n=1 Tax=uncultured Clostridium sp. TaxID=59620 RepID=UPI002605BB6E|nr:MBL fold metallo-hydrolase [uncultured Clostridium sp.]